MPVLFQCDSNKVHLYECQFSYLPPTKAGMRPMRANASYMVLAVSAEDALAACSEQGGAEMVLHQIIKRNHNQKVLVTEAAIATTEPGN